MTALLKKSRKIVLTENIVKKISPFVLISVALLIVCGGIEIFTRYQFPSVFCFIIGFPFMATFITGIALGGALSYMKMDQVAAGKNPPSAREMFWVRTGLGFFNIMPGSFIAGKLFPLIGVSQLYESALVIEYIAKFIVALFFGFLYNKIVKAIIATFFTFPD